MTRSITLRKYQVEALASIDVAEATGKRRLLVQMATGLGKTILFGVVVANTPGRSLILAHRDELIEQAVEKLRAVESDLDVGVVKAQRHEVDHRVVVGSVQTLANERRRRDLGDFERVVVDEAHHTAAASYRAILEDTGCFAPDGPLLLGVTATPVRGDHARLDDIYERIVYEYPILTGIRNNYLSDLRGVRVQLAGLNLDRVKTRGGDWSEGQLGEALEAADAPEHVAAAYQTHAPGRKGLVFAPTVALASAMAETLTETGVRAELVYGGQSVDERRAVLARFRNGETQVVTNCAVLTEGFDEPSVDAIVIARPTQSEALYAQMIGRGTRKYPGKDDCLVIDMVGASARHSLMTVNTLFGLPLRAATGSQTVMEVLAEREAQEARTAAAAGVLQAQVVDLFTQRQIHWIRSGSGWMLATGDGCLYLRPVGNEWNLIEATRHGRSLRGQGSLEWLMGQAEDMARNAGASALIAKGAPWRARPASDKQIAYLSSLRVHVDLETVTAGEASDLIAQAKARRLLVGAR